MGQASSSENTCTSLKDSLSFANEAECSFYLYNKVENILPSLANATFDQKLKVYQEYDNITFEHLLPLLNVYALIDPRLCSVMNNVLRRLSNFPIIEKPSGPVQYQRLKMACLILSSPDLCHKLLNDKSYDYNKLIFMSLLPIEDNDTISEMVKEKEMSVESDSVCDSSLTIQDYSTVDIDNAEIPATTMLLFLTFITTISHFTLLKRKISPDYIKEHWIKYQRGPALNILRTMNKDITAQNIKEKTVYFEQFNEAILNEFPRLFKSLNNLFLSLFEADHPSFDIPLMETALFSLEVRSQLSTFMSAEFVYADIIKLYSGKDVGFSMRAIQSKVLKWNAPTLLIIKGQLLLDDDNNPRYKKFINQEYPRLGNAQSTKEQVTYAVYIDEPWKITNKNLFGGAGTEIIELQPRQCVHKSSGCNSLGYLYFNVMGGGIGIGNKVQPLVKNSVKKYNPGNVSLTIDSGLEFGCFRNVGHGGLFKPGCSYETGLDQEYRFIIEGMEVWGCGGEDVLKEQLEAWKWEENEAKRRQRVDVKSMGDDRALLEMAGLVGQNQSGGSM